MEELLRCAVEQRQVAPHLTWCRLQCAALTPKWCVQAIVVQPYMCVACMRYMHAAKSNAGMRAHQVRGVSDTVWLACCMTLITHGT